jgi:AcrR family transcriptional regulator
MPKVVAGYKEEARRTILETASQVFAEKGYNDTTMDDVAKKLGVSKGAVYQYFASKDELFQAICGSAAKKVEEMLRASFTGPPIRDSAENYMKAELDRVERRQMIMFEAIAEAHRNPVLNKVLRDNHVAVRDVLVGFLDGLKGAGLIKRSVDSNSAAEFLIALRHGVITSVFQGLGREEAIKLWLEGFDMALGVARGRGASKKD